METVERAEAVAAIYRRYPERSKLLLPRASSFILAHWWYSVWAGGVPVAVVGLIPVRSAPWKVVGLLVVPAHRNHGLGSRLMEHIQTASVIQHHEAGLELATVSPTYFTRFGFRPSGLATKTGIQRMVWP